MGPIVVRRINRLCIAAVSAFFTAQGNAADVREGTSGTVLEEVIVSAQKREENLQTVPVSVTVLTADQLKSLQLTSGTEVAQQTPNLRVSNLGNEDQPKFSMRGIATPDFNLNTTSPTGIFYDEVYVASQFLGGPQIFDLERVEVLRGPQGTLFGKNTTGGAVNFITRAPSFDTNGYLTAQAGNNSYYHGQGAFNFALNDQLATRFAFNGSKSDGWIENANPAGEDLSSINNYALRWSWRYQSTGGLDAILRLTHSRSHPTNIGVIAYGTGTGETNALGVNPRINPLNGRRFDAFQGYYDRTGGSIRADGDGATLTLNKKLGDYSLTSITSYVKGDFKNNVDADGSISDLLAIDFYARTKEMGQDLRLASNFDGPFNFIAGLYYYRDTVGINTDYFLFVHSFNLFQSYDQERKSYAIYADGTYDFATDWTLYGGVRWTSDKGEVTDFRVIPTIPLQPTKSYSDSAPTGRLGVRRQFSPQVMGYLQYARGYRSSAINGSALTNSLDLNVADPEYLDSFETGLKTQLLDRRLQLNVSAFLYNYKNQQFINTISLTNSQVVNAGEARLYGLEAELTAQVTSNLRASVGLGLLHTEYVELTLRAPDPVTGVLRDFNLEGNELIEAPKESLNVALDYTIRLSGNGEIRLHGDANYLSSQFYSAFNLQRQGYHPNDISVAPAHWVSDARAAFHAASGKYEVAIWGKNLGNNDVPAGQVAADNGGAPYNQHFTVSPYPRRYGVEFNWNF